MTMTDGMIMNKTVNKMRNSPWSIIANVELVVPRILVVIRKTTAYEISASPHELQCRRRERKKTRVR